MSSKKKILVVEDEPVNQQLIQETLINSGFDVTLAANGQEGLDQVYLEHPDLVICDVLMPIMDGYSFYKELRKDELYSQIPVIILTVRGKMEDTFKTVGVNSFITKPYSAAILLKEVQKLLNKSTNSPSGSPANSHNKVQSLNHKVIIVGHNSHVTNTMNKQLEQENCGVLVIKDENQLSLHFDRVNPDIILLQIFDDGFKSIIDVLLELKKLISRKFQELQVKALSDGQLEYRMPYILLYRVTEEVQGISTRMEEASAMENLLEKCIEILPIKYLGIYVPGSFIPKVQNFLKK